MFIFNKKKKKINILESMYNVIYMQLFLIEQQNENIIELAKKNPMVLGYFLGYCDSFIQNTVFYNGKINNHCEDIAITFYIIVFDEIGEEFFNNSLLKREDLQSNMDFIVGMDIGGNDFVNFFNDKKYPMGLLNMVENLK
jgi:hypothetical protein